MILCWQVIGLINHLDRLETRRASAPRPNYYACWQLDTWLLGRQLGYDDDALMSLHITVFFNTWNRETWDKKERDKEKRKREKEKRKTSTTTGFEPVRPKPLDFESNPLTTLARCLIRRAIFWHGVMYCMKLDFNCVVYTKVRRFADTRRDVIRQNAEAAPDFGASRNRVA